MSIADESAPVHASKPMASTQPTSFRLSPDAVRMIEELEAAMGLKRTAVIEQAIRQLHKREVGKKPRKKPEDDA